MAALSCVRVAGVMSRCHARRPAAVDTIDARSAGLNATGNANSVWAGVTGKVPAAYRTTLRQLAPAALAEDRILYGIGLMCLYVSLIVFVNAGGKVLSTGYHPHQIVFFRHGVAFLLMLAVFMPRHGWRIVVPRRPKLQIARGLFGITSSILYFTGLATISLATAAAISFTQPLVVTALSAPLLGERVGLHRWAAVAAGFAGALIIIRPGGSGEAEWAALLLVGSACCTAMYQIITRKLAGQDHAETTNIWSGLVGSVVVCALVPFSWRTPDEVAAWAMFLSLGLIGGTAHYLLTKAFERGPASLLSPFNYLQLVGATIIGYLLYRQLPDAWTWIGAAVIVGAGLYIALRESRHRHAQTNTGKRPPPTPGLMPGQRIPGSKAP